MKTVFDKQTRTALITRIGLLKASDKALWGKMDAFQMLKHCNLSEELFLGKKNYKRLFIGKLFGRMTLKGMMKDDGLMKQNQPTHPEFKITGSGDFETEKQKWMSQLAEYESYAGPGVTHPFFGTMTSAEIGAYVYKHTDHHLRQFKG